VRNPLRPASDEAPGRALVSGAMIDRFRVERVIRTRPDAFTLLEATAPDGERVMLTVLASSTVADRKLRRHVLGLAGLRASINHPNLLPVHGVHESGDRVYLVSGLPAPATLADELGTSRLDAQETLMLLGEVAGGLETALQHGLLHRDLTPEAIALTDGRPPHAVLTDFGIALPAARGCELLSTSGGAAYRSPEEVRGEPLEPESNVYSLACILVECLSGSTPYPYPRPLLTLHAHVVEPPPRVSERHADIPAALDPVVAKAMAKDPGERYESPARLVRAAGDALGLEPVIPVVAAPRKERRPAPTPAPRRQLRPRVRLATVGIGLALFVSVVSGFATGSVDWSEDAGPSAAARSPSPADTHWVAQAVFVNDVAGSVDRLRARRGVARRRLREARHPNGQAAAATALADAYRDVRKALPAPPAGSPRLGDDLLRAERAYRRLAAAALRHNQRAWRSARRETETRERALATTLRSVRVS
jgi:eukaryotic-like serine/threonine-protein kinase